MQLNLSNIKQSLILDVVSSSVNIHYQISYTLSNVNNVDIPITTEGYILTTGITTLIEPPEPGVFIKSMYINIFNNGSPLTNVKLKIKNNSQLYTICKFSLLQEQYMLIDESGFHKYNDDGEEIVYMTGTLATTGGSSNGDMLTSIYDVDLSGIVDDAERLGGELPSYYLSLGSLNAILATLKYTVTLGNVTTVTITGATHLVPNVSGINVFNTSNKNVMVSYDINSTNQNVTINSNISLNSHRLEIY